MIRALDARELGLDRIVAVLARPPADVAPEIQRAVDDILADVRGRGDAAVLDGSEERRVGKECRSRWSPYH